MSGLITKIARNISGAVNDLVDKTANTGREARQLVRERGQVRQQRPQRPRRHPPGPLGLVEEPAHPGARPAGGCEAALRPQPLEGPRLVEQLEPPGARLDRRDWTTLILEKAGRR